MHKRKEVPEPPAERSILSVAEAAALSGLGENTIRALVKTGELPARRVRRRVLIRRVDLVTLVSPNDHDLPKPANRAEVS
jgi:excisionase family DNA binding protein